MGLCFLGQPEKPDTFAYAFPVSSAILRTLPQERIFQLTSGMPFKDLVVLVEL